jgi:uncharacterized protein (TIGR04255 family)
MSRSSPVAATSDGALLNFANPPVDETALSFQFAPIPGFTIPHYGLFWAEVRKDFPKFEIQQPITNVTEQFGPPTRVSRKLGIEWLDVPDIRCWFIDQSGDRLIQVQKDRFVHNWRKQSGTETYPRYQTLRGYLNREWHRFCQFLSEENLERPRVHQVDVTYVNHIEYGKGWDGFGQLHRVIEAMAAPKAKERILPEAERVNMQMIFRLPDDAGRLYITFTPVIRGRDGKEVLQMTLIARVATKSSDEDEVFQALDLGRKWVVEGFGDFTTAEMHQIWGKL